MKKQMRIKDVGATINLGNYSSLHVTIGEPSEFAGLDIGKAEDYLRNIAEAVGGTLNLPERTPKKTKKSKKTEGALIEPTGEKVFSFGGTTFAYYDHAKHTYTTEEGVVYSSVTQMLESFYPFNAKNVIKQEYMDFASSYGNLIHTAIQNGVIGYPPKKKMVSKVVQDVLDAMGKFDKMFVEQVVIYPDEEMAGRFDILTQTSDGKVTLWDVKTNSDIFASVTCSLPEQLKKSFGEYWNVETVYGEHCLQLNTYRHIIEHTSDWHIDEIKIIHVPDDFKEILDVPIVDTSSIFSAYGAIR